MTNETKCTRLTATVKKQREGGFTRTDLIAVLALFLLGVFMLLPAMGRTRSNGSVAQCLNNLRNLGVAWTMYIADHRGALVSAHPGTGCPPNVFNWCQGYAGTISGSGSYCYAATSATGIKTGRLWPYLKSLATYKCPADARTISSLPVLRSYSMNGWMNGLSYGDPSGSTSFFTPDNDSSLRFRFFRKESGLINPGGLLVIVDEDGMSINDSMFLIDMGGAGRGLIDAPARRHDNSFGLSFADAHAEMRKLRDPRSVSWASLPVSGGTQNLDYMALTNNATTRR